MPEFHFEGQFYHLISNLGIAAGYLSMAVALVVGARRGLLRFNKFGRLMCGLFIGAVVGRILIALQIDGYLPVLVDAVTCALAVAAGFLVWKVVEESSSSPTYKSLASVNEELEYHRTLFESFMEHSPAATFLEDGDAKLLYVNAAFEQSIGLKREDLINRPTALWATAEQAESIEEHNRQCRRESRPIGKMLYFPKKPGQESEPWYVVRFPIAKTLNGAVVGAIALSMAGEEQRAELNAKLAAIVESSQDAIIGKDLHGTITSWNKGAEELYGYSAEEAVGKPIAMLVPLERKDEVPALLDKITRGVRIDNYETLRISKDGHLKHVSLSMSPIRSIEGHITGAALIARDISKEKLQQKEIEQLNKQLKDRVYELAEQTAALQTARDQALEASNLKSAFFANISHELRTPLAGIMGLNEMLLETGNLQGEDADLARMVQESAQALLTVVNDILDLTKIEAGKITLENEPFNPYILLQDCTRLMAPNARQKNLKYELVLDQELPDMIYGDVSRVRQVILNLLGNAIKFTQEGTVQVRADVLDKKDDKATIRFSIKDTGIGISAAEQRFLFMPFGQVDNSISRKFSGTGLGLTISKRFVELMNGRMDLESEKGVGSTFSFTVQFDRKRLHEATDFSTEKMYRPAVGPIPADLALGRAILIVEDNTTLQDLALRQLSTLGIEAGATVFGKEAIELALTDCFAVVLMDINLPDMTGLEAAAEIRRLEHIAMRPEIPIIAMTAGAMKGDRERAIAAGMNDYLAKPVPIEELKTTLERWLRLYKVGKPPSNGMLVQPPPLTEGQSNFAP